MNGYLNFLIACTVYCLTETWPTDYRPKIEVHTV